MERVDVLNILCEAYCQVFKKALPLYDENLLGSRLKNDVISYIYWFDLVEKMTGKPVSKVLEESNHTVMSLNRLADRIFEVYFKIDCK